MIAIKLYALLEKKTWERVPSEDYEFQIQVL
jgi:hypothetical protein